MSPAVELPDDAPTWVRVLHHDLGRMRTEAADHAAATTQRLGDVVGAVDRLATEVRGSTDALRQRVAVDEAWVGLWRQVIEHPTVGRVTLVVAVLVVVRLLLPPGAEQAVLSWAMRVVQ